MMGKIVPAGNLSRRRFIRVCAVAAAGAVLPSSIAQSSPGLHRWKGIALGAHAEIILAEKNAAKAQALFNDVEAEIRRLEAIFSLYQPSSELVQLNRNGRIAAPSLDLVNLLGLSRQIHALTDGAFDPTVQPLWAFYAERAARGDAFDTPSARAEFQAVRERIGFENVAYAPDLIEFRQRGMALTMNGIAQGYITDRVTALLRSKGCKNLVVDLGEVSASGHNENPDTLPGVGWPITLRPDPSRPAAKAKVEVVDACVASSARTATAFDQAGKKSHILDPKTGLPVESDLEAASVIAPSAAIADGLSTAALVCGEKRLASALAGAPQSSAFVARNSGTSGWLNRRSS